jgi:hypothetical protein
VFIYSLLHSSYSPSCLNSHPSTEPTDETLQQIAHTVKTTISQIIADCLEYYKVLRASSQRIAYTSEAVQLHIMTLVYSNLFELCKRRVSFFLL